MRPDYKSLSDLELDAHFAEKVLGWDLNAECPGDLMDGDHWSCDSCGITGRWGDDSWNRHRRTPYGFTNSLNAACTDWAIDRETTWVEMGTSGKGWYCFIGGVHRAVWHCFAGDVAHGAVEAVHEKLSRAIVEARCMYADAVKAAGR